jgi:hypothetical protein
VYALVVCLYMYAYLYSNTQAWLSDLVTAIEACVALRRKSSRMFLQSSTTATTSTTSATATGTADGMLCNYCQCSCHSVMM